MLLNTLLETEVATLIFIFNGLFEICRQLSLLLNSLLEIRALFNFLRLTLLLIFNLLVTEPFLINTSLMIMKCGICSDP